MKSKIYNVKLTKMRSTHGNLRADEVFGQTLDLPTVGKSFILIADPLDAKAEFRSVFTTEIKLVEKMGDTYEFHTLNSTYRVEVLGEEAE